MNLITDTLTYAWRGNGKLIFIWLVILSVGSYFSEMVPLIGGIAGLLIYGYFCACFCHFVEHSATNQPNCSSWPDLGNFVTDILVPIVRVIVIQLLVIIPVFIFPHLYATDQPELISFLILIPGALYAPMALLAWIILNTPKGISPHIVLPALYRIGSVYWISIASAIAILTVLYFINTSIESAPHIAVPLAALLSTYSMMSLARLLGLLFHERQEHLDWL